MQVITLYRYKRSDGGITLSTTVPEDGVSYTTKFRLIADEGKVLSKDTITISVIDTDTSEGWEEIYAPSTTEEYDSLTETEEKAKAYDIITGVSQ